MKKFVAMEGPVFDPETGKERVRLKIYLDDDVYEQLVAMADERNLTPAKLLSFILTDWACGDDGI